jgi:branched-chain amino acid transport system ATP-binding protein
VTAALVLRDVVAGYEPGLPIVRGACVEVASGEVVVLLGPNGAGKSTLVKAAAGLVAISAGAVLLEGADIGAVPAHARIRHGLAFVPQTENVFASLSVADNLAIAASVLPRAARPARIAAMLAMFPDLAAARHGAAGRLSGGQRQMLAIARAMVVAPRVLVLDEPSAGLSPLLVTQVLRVLRDIAAAGVAVLLVEQNARAALAVADRALILAEGRVAHEGRGAALLSDPVVAALYLGGARAA